MYKNFPILRGNKNLTILIAITQTIDQCSNLESFIFYRKMFIVMIRVKKKTLLGCWGYFYCSQGLQLFIHFKLFVSTTSGSTQTKTTVLFTCEQDQLHFAFWHLLIFSELEPPFFIFHPTVPDIRLLEHQSIPLKQKDEGRTTEA